MEESDLVVSLSSLDGEMITRLHQVMLPCDPRCRWLLDKELATRLAGRLNDENLRRLWQLLQDKMDDDCWACAAACLLSAHIGRINADLKQLPSKVLKLAVNYMDVQDSAIAFAQGFFKYDLGISQAEQWPRRSTAPIFLELAERLEGDASEEKLQLLVRGHGIDESHAFIRKSLSKQLHEHILNQESGQASAMEGLFLKLTLEEAGYVPEDVLPKLTLAACHLREALPEQLMSLTRQLSQADRREDGARVATFAAKAFLSDGMVAASEDAFLEAFALDQSNKEAAQGAVAAVTSTRRRCCELQDRCKGIEERNKALVDKCQALERRCGDLESLASSVKMDGDFIQTKSTITWDLSGYDFTEFTKGQIQKSEKFQLLSSGVNAWLQFTPGMAALSLYVDKPAVVKCVMQSGSKISTLEYDFSDNLVGEMPLGRGFPAFVKTSEINGSIIVRILSVRAPGSTLRFS